MPRMINDGACLCTAWRTRSCKLRHAENDTIIRPIISPLASEIGIRVVVRATNIESRGLAAKFKVTVSSDNLTVA
jgi:hypothetical protein